MYTLDQVRCFVAVAQHKHFGRAAEELAMTQPPLSRQIQKLERAIGVVLLERDNRKVTLTAGGQAFLHEAEALLAIADRAPRQAQRIAQGNLGQIDIAFTAATGFELLGRLLNSTSAKLPGVHLDLHEMVTSEQIEAIRSGRIDIGIGRLAHPLEGLDSTVVRTEDLVLALSVDDPLATAPGPLHRQDITGRTLLMHHRDRARYFYELIVKHFEPDRSQINHSLSQVTTMISLVAHGHGIALVPESARALGISGVTYRKFDDLPTNLVETHAIWSPTNHNPALARWRSEVI